MSRTSKQAETNLVMILSFLVIFNTVSIILSLLGAILLIAVLTIVVDFGALILILIFLPRLRWK